MIVKKSTPEFLRLIQQDFLKLKRTAIVWLTIGIALFLPLIKFLVYYFRWEAMRPKNGENPWQNLVNDNWQIIDMLLLPFFIILVTSLIVQIEHKSIAWKYLFVQPVRRANLYLAKLTVIGVVISAFLILQMIFALAGGVILGVVRPQLNLFGFVPDFAGLGMMTVKSICAVAGLTAFQYLLAVRFKNFAIPLGIGICGIIASQIIWLWDKSIYFFYAAPILTSYSYQKMINPKKVGFLAEHEVYSLLFMLLVLLAGYLWDRKKSIVG